MMMANFLIRYALLALAAMPLVLVMPVVGAEVFTVGKAARSWAAVGTTPGGVIAFVEDLQTVRDEAGVQVFGQVPDSLRGWIMPLRLDPDFNISRGVVERGGNIDVPILASSDKDPEQLEGMLNGDHAVAFDRKFVAGRIVRNNGITFRLDLGARFGVDRVVFYPRMTPQFPFANDYLRAYELYLNDGSPQNLYASGQPIFAVPVLRQPDNTQVRVDAQVEPQFVRYLELKSISTLGFEIDEIEVYGRGFVPTARYISDVLDLGEDAVWGKIRWTEAITGAAAEARVEVRVRSGSDETPDVYFRSVSVDGRRELVRVGVNGDTLTAATYERLKETERGPVRGDADHWSQWQLIANGADLNLPAPRRYLQFSIDFFNRNLDASRAIADLEFDFERPPVDRIVAEIGPPVTPVGEVTTFTYIARISNASGRPGFERFEVETPGRVEAVRSVEIRDGQNNLLESAVFDLDLDAAALPLRQGGFSIEAVEDDFFALGLPRLRADGALLKIVFDAAVFRYGTRFEGRAFADAAALISLQTEGGDATPELATDELLVRVSLGSKVAGPLEVSPAVFTPNGDGINDEAQISYTVLHLLEPSPVRLGVYDLGGRLVRQLDERAASNGRFVVQWDGRDEAGATVPPGLYLIQVEIKSDRKTERRAASIAVVH